MAKINENENEKNKNSRGSDLERLMEPKDGEKQDELRSTPQNALCDNRYKRKHILVLDEKIAAIHAYEQDPVYNRIGRKFHCSPDQIKRIVQQKVTILRAWEQRNRRNQDYKTRKSKVVRASLLNMAVYNWIRRMIYYQDFIITDGLIQKMALKFKSAMGLNNFFPHQDWCNKFRQTYNLHVNDSKLLSIGHTQGHSVRIKDIIKDVLRECAPDSDTDSNSDAVDDVIEVDDDVRMDLPDNVHDRSGAFQNKHEIGNGDTSNKMLQQLPQLIPNTQLIALPKQANSVDAPPKLLAATQITAGGQMQNAEPMPMTIIPLTTLAQSQSQYLQFQQEQQQLQQQGQPSQTQNQQQKTLPVPSLDIKQEIKEEPEDVCVKQECISYAEEDFKASSDIAITTTKIEPLEEQQRDGDQTQQQEQQHTEKPSLLKAVLCAPTTLTYNTETYVQLAAHLPTFLASTSASKIPTSDRNSIIYRECTSTETTPPLPLFTEAPTFSRSANELKCSQNDFTALPAIKSSSEARRYLKLLEDYALCQENYRLVGLITRADNLLCDMGEFSTDEDINVG